MQGWQIVQQLEQKQVDSWERIYEAYAVKSPNDEANWDATDDVKVADFARACPLLSKQAEHSTCLLHLPHSQSKRHCSMLVCFSPPTLGGLTFADSLITSSMPRQLFLRIGMLTFLSGCIHTQQFQVASSHRSGFGSSISSSSSPLREKQRASGIAAGQFWEAGQFARPD